jgi:phage major head subunit gpT-like protein
MVVTKFRRKKADRLYNPTSSTVQEAVERDRNNYNIDRHREVGITYSSMSEAFKDANYATPFWKCESDFDVMMRYISDTIIGALLAISSISLFIYGLYIWSKG